ncbi:hypothetical protein UPYG_G00134270 [Umbra pygmaea]|uniref:EGF-like domain-containing protein n=1 Tax=Umbra pygmaea TaxID=75934 RepID=A0ABD0WTR9_UMBPY
MSWMKVTREAAERRNMKTNRLSFHILGVTIVFLNAAVVVRSQTFCNRAASLEWHLQPQAAHVRWTLLENICNNTVQCWGDPESTETQPFDVWPIYNLPQICPVELQFGDNLFMSADDTLDLYGIKIINVSREDFDSCSTAPQAQDQFLFNDDNINGTRQVKQKWLPPGLHYFLASHKGNSQLCKLGLRLNVSVKEQQCQSNPLVRFCSGNGVCRTSFLENSEYQCQCHLHYSGKFCQRFDACLENPCENNGVCMSNGTTDHSFATYRCLCPPYFTGVNCSDVIGRENCDRVCRNGTCLQVSPSSYKCMCNTEHPGLPCGTPCDPNPCKNAGECEESDENANGYICACQKGSTGLHCETPVPNNCLSHGCQREHACSLKENISPECVASAGQCEDGTSGPQCTQGSPCSPSPCLNNGSCFQQEDDFICRVQ